MIPSKFDIARLWDTYHLPEYKRQHVRIVAQVALFLSVRLKEHDPSVVINDRLLRAAALLHDIDKEVPKLPGERHPDAGVRILADEGLDEVATLVKTHPLHTILNPTLAPKTWEEKLLFLADKMVKHSVISVDERFALWREEDLPRDARHMLHDTYPKVKALESDILKRAGVTLSDIQRHATEAAIRALLAKVPSLE
ncbi:HD domain-containing protein [Patescibacteria group bacterium]|nr:HD domain-containing protein [Patescibacteria group bacterium]